jgi:hypothetical protein
MHRPFIVIILFYLLSAAAPTAAEGEAALTAEPVRLFEAPDERERIGNLIWRGGFALRHPDKRFGGISSIQISEDGKKLLAISDRGHAIRFSLRHDNGRLAAITLDHIATLAMPPGEKRRNFSIDAESSAMAGKDTLLIAFERINRILAYPRRGLEIGTDPKLYPRPPAMAQLPKSSGVEAMARLCDNRLLLLSEGGGRFGGDAVLGWIEDRRGWHAFGYRSSEGYVPTAAALLPNCRIAVVERRFFLLSFYWRIALLSPDDIRPGATVSGLTAAHFRYPAVTDNFEAIAARRNKTGETLLYLMSDDNFSSLQQTLLLVFALNGGDGSGASDR